MLIARDGGCVPPLAAPPVDAALVVPPYYLANVKADIGVMLTVTIL